MTEAAPEQKAKDTVTLTVDGEAVSCPPGIPLIEAIRMMERDVSAFCYHPGLKIVAVCRQCLVRIEGSPKLVPACQAVVKEGMVVHTLDEDSMDARRQMLEFTLVNHPIDCPICDKAGECTLQSLYFDNNNKPSRVDVPKVKKKKAVDLGPHIVLDQERCILCTRCIRVCDEVAEEHQLEMANRGDHEELDVAPGAKLDNPYSLNTVDVCPVGALTAKDFRFTLRAWELMTTPSVCQGCSTGCNIEVHHRDERSWRIVPRHNPSVNGHWMCDEGRFTYHGLREKRLAGPLVSSMPSSWENATKKASQLLGGILNDSRQQLGVVLSTKHTNEDNYALAKLAKELWQLENIYVSGTPSVPDRADGKLRMADVNPNTKGVTEIIGNGGKDLSELSADLEQGKLRGLLILGHELPTTDGAAAALSNLEALIVVTDKEDGVAKQAQVTLPAAAWAEVDGTVTNHDGLVQRMYQAYQPMGQSIPAWEAVCRLALASDAALSFDDSKSVFNEMKTKVEAFNNSEWGKPVLPIQLRFANSRG